MQTEYMESTMKPELNKRPYKLTVLNSCYSHDKFMVAAFGVDFAKSGTTCTVDDYKNCARQPRAYVGWKGEIIVPGALPFIGYPWFGQHSAYTRGLTNLWGRWVDGDILRDCVDSFGTNVVKAGFPGATSWKISGCEDLKIGD